MDQATYDQGTLLICAQYAEFCLPRSFGSFEVVISLALPEYNKERVLKAGAPLSRQPILYVINNPSYVAPLFMKENTIE